MAKHAAAPLLRRCTVATPRGGRRLASLRPRHHGLRPVGGRVSEREDPIRSTELTICAESISKLCLIGRHHIRQGGFWVTSACQQLYVGNGSWTTLPGI